KDPGDKGFLSSVEMLRVAETVLIAVKSWHSSARERGLRSGEGWADVEKKLDDALLRAQLDRVQALAAAKLWGDAFKLANDLADTHVDNKEVQRVTNLLRVQESLLALQNNPTPDFEDFRKARIRLEDVERRFPEESKKQGFVNELRTLLRD